MRFRSSFRRSIVPLVALMFGLFLGGELSRAQAQAPVPTPLRPAASPKPIVLNRVAHNADLSAAVKRLAPGTVLLRTVDGVSAIETKGMSILITGGANHPVISDSTWRNVPPVPPPPPPSPHPC
jgi:hypothetical protein